VFAAVHAWAFDITPSAGFWTVAAVVGIALLGVAWFALRFWLASTRPPNIRDIQTPSLDRLNRQALEAKDGEAEADDEEAPEGLKKVVQGEPNEKKR
jgi:hypothetical protein